MKNEDEPFVYKKVSGSAIIFLVLYVNDTYSLEMTSLPCRVSSLGWGNVFQ